MKKQFVFLALVVLGCQSVIAGQNFSTMTSLDQYIQESRANQPPLQTSQGSLYSDSALNSQLFTDRKARRVNDILTVRILESTQAQSAADAQTSRNSSLSLGLPNFFGLENRNLGVPFDTLATAESNLSFQGDGSTTRTGSVVALVSARVKEVLPNGDMVIEGVKEVKVNKESQLIRLFGVVRAKDIGADNVVFSTAIANMLVQVDGKGMLSDNLEHGWLFGLLTKVWPF